MLISLSSLLLFVAGALVLLVIPGPAVTYIVSRSIEHGRTAGLVSVMGVVSGTLCHVAAATLGLTALLLSSPRSLQFVKYFGAAYIVYLGIRRLRTEDTEWVEAAKGDRRFVRLFGEGMLVNLLNPKTFFFFFAFLPQFVDQARGHATAQILELGMLFVVLSWCTDSLYAWAGGTIGTRIRGNARLRRAERNIAGGFLIALGIACAFAGARTK
jgi:threonine/homoserine/homoserine lactone efflux protein